MSIFLLSPLFSAICSNYIVGPGNNLSINGVVSENAGKYRCAFEVEEDVYLFSNPGELEYLGEGIITVN